MAPLEAPVPGSLRPFDPTAYTGKAQAATPPSDPAVGVKVDDKANLENLGTGTPIHEDRISLKGFGSAVPTDPAGIAPSTKSTTTVDKAATENAGTERLVSLRVIEKIFNAEVDDKNYTFAQVGGWTCKIPPRQYREGELVLYFQIDSFLPGVDDRFGTGSGRARKLQMLDGKLGQRLKTEKFGSGEDKVLSQGMIMPVQTFPEIWKTLEVVRQFISKDAMERNVGLINATLLIMYRDRNWAEVLGVKKWEDQLAQPDKPEHRRLGNYPGEVFRRTDVTRVQDCLNLFQKHKYNSLVYQESVKMDGSAMVVYFVKKSCRHFNSLNPLPEKVGPNTVLEGARFGVCSNKVDKNELEEDGPNAPRYWQTALRHDLPAKLSKLGANIAIQGELCGDAIQGNREGLPEGEQEFFVYAMFDIDKQQFIHPRRVELMAKELGLKHVPVVGYVKLTEIASNHQDFQKRAAQRKGEGLVFKCVRDGRRFKVISNTYLLEHGL
ncbi:hypothetical protein KVR01_002853 [Diaporthe batatas]|uniref:uncharacterized protein n=1 Tax=Diaporthe batatas TaxID=748121 RepID=UPI001D03E16D|nr:uncharacterized protein KVR01_002853 [Diaporthe batatas]KAG8167164.1 hypothetical protein KVR01_002853 [Diaporthe batatas]